MKKRLSILFILHYCGPVHAAGPVIDSVVQASYHQADVYFSEAVSLASSQTAGNYSADNGMGYALTAIRDSFDQSLVHLSFSQAFTNGQYYTLTVTGVQDLAGNTTMNATRAFLFFIPEAGDVVINEIMADPNPSQGLPDHEYVELFNRTHFPLRLKGWAFTYGSLVKIFPYVILPADSFLILCLDSAVSSFQAYGPALGLFTSSTALSNAGTTLILRNPAGNIIHAVSYNDTWYQDPIKNNGGWSLEQIDPNSPCSGKPNWKAALELSGGTPGKRNSANASAPDIKPPAISYVSIVSSNSIRLILNEYTDSTTLALSSNFFVDHGMGNPISANPIGPDFTGVILTLPAAIQSNIIYTISLKNIRDCAGNVIVAGSAAQFAVPEHAGAKDIVINEVLFAPRDNGAEWIEIYNRSEKVVDLKGLYLCNSDAAGNFFNINQIAPDGRLMLPHEYMVLSKDQAAIKAQYNTENREAFMDMASFISMNDDSSCIALINASQAVIDKLCYHSDWHLPLINDTKGISLERLTYDNATQDPGNWHSSAESAGGSTPAYQNSQYTNGESASEITVSPEVFSPDNDGYNDVLSISYVFDSPGLIGNVQVYDHRGRLMKVLVRNELLGTSGTFFWDGFTDEKMKARIGVYIVYFETFDLKGNVKQFKKSCVVAGKL